MRWFVVAENTAESNCDFADAAVCVTPGSMPVSEVLAAIRSNLIIAHPAEPLRGTAQHRLGVRVAGRLSMR